MRIVPGFNKLEDSHSGLGWGLEAASVEEFTFQRGKETLIEGVVETIHRPIREKASHRPPCLASRRRSRGTGLLDRNGWITVEGAALPQGHIHASSTSSVRRCVLLRPPYNPPEKSIQSTTAR